MQAIGRIGSDSADLSTFTARGRRHDHRARSGVLAAATGAIRLDWRQIDLGRCSDRLCGPTVS
jgi:hypothetical protein